jgi:hypothetical protein
MTAGVRGDGSYAPWASGATRARAGAFGQVVGEPTVRPIS